MDNEPKYARETGDPHDDGRVAESGAPLHRAKAAAIFVHGRGATTESILTLADELAQPDVAYFAPQAAGNTWYAFSFLAPLDRNEPGLSSGLRAIDAVRSWIEEAGIPPEKILLLGFSQGACLATEYAARHARKFGGVACLSGGLIGTSDIEGADPPADKRFEYEGSLDGTPVFLGCSDVDAHIPVQRVHDSTRVLGELGGDVTERIYPGMSHSINEDEVRFVRGMLSNIVSP